MESNEIEAKLLAFQRNHAVVFEIARKTERLREVAMFGDATQINGLPVELEFFAVGNESADAELLAVCTFGR